MKFLILFAAVLFSLNSFAFLEDYPAQYAKKQYENTIDSDPIDLDLYLRVQMVSVRADDLKWTGAQAIYKKEEYLAWQSRYVTELERLINFFDLISTKPLSSEDKRFAYMGSIVAKTFKFKIESNALDFAKFIGDTSIRPNMMNVWPGNTFIINAERMEQLNSLDDRAYMATFFHELVHSYYSNPATHPSSGPDSIPYSELQRRGDCRYQEGLAYGAQVRLYKLLNAYDKAVDLSKISPSAASAIRAFGDSSKWAQFLNSYCGVGVAK